jgi:hypothetical protein
MSYAFFSYSRADEAFAEKLATDLKANGVKLWYDQADLSLCLAFVGVTHQSSHPSSPLLRLIDQQRIA